jgi:CRISPR-associated protein Cmr5
MTQTTRSAQQTLQQRRAAHAWACVEEVGSKKPEDFRKKYGSLVRRLPALIQTDGLGQTLAFLLAKDGKSKNKGDTEHIEAYRNISDWMVSEHSGLGIKYKQGETLLEWLLKQPTTDYRRATAEVLAYLNWLKRFAEAKGWQDEE